VLLEFVNGRPLSLEEGHLLPTKRLAALLQPIEAALEEFSPPFRPVAETRVFHSQMTALYAQLGDSPAQRERLGGLFDELQAWEEEVNLPSRVIHADIHAGNILIEEGQPLDSGDLWLIDFDDAHVSYRAIDWVLPAIEFSLRRDGSLDEARYASILALLATNASTVERAAFPRLRKMMLLKFAAAYSMSGHSRTQNPYLLALSGET
jgi:Ser/Thr protein kinase RdoA (MazF antagonist)